MFPGESIPLMYPEGMLFLGIFYSISDYGGIIGVPSAHILSESNTYGFASI